MASHVSGLLSGGGRGARGGDVDLDDPGLLEEFLEAESSSSSSSSLRGGRDVVEGLPDFDKEWKNTHLEGLPRTLLTEATKRKFTHVVELLLTRGAQGDNKLDRHIKYGQAEGEQRLVYLFRVHKELRKR